MSDQVSSLFSLAHSLLTLGQDGSPIYVDSFTRLNRALNVLPLIPASLLKVRLLTYCYGEVYAEELAKEAHVIIDSWGTFRLTAEQEEAIEELKNIEENPYPWEEAEA